MKRRGKITALALGVCLALNTTGCVTASFKRDMKNFEAGVNGLPRIATVYSATGEEIAKYSGKDMLVTDGEGGTVTIEFEGTKVMFSNVSVIIEEIK